MNSFFHVTPLAFRKFLQDVIQATLEEVNSSQTFQALTDAVNREIQKKEQLQQTILRYELRRYYHSLACSIK